MQVRFYHHGKTEYEQPYLEQMTAGLLAHGHQIEVVAATSWRDCGELADVAAFVGVRGVTREIIQSYRDAGRRSVVLDKGAIRRSNVSDYRRVYLDGGSCLAYLMRVKRPSDRWDRLGIEIEDRVGDFRRAPIVYANNSQKVHDYWQLGDGQALAEQVIGKLRRIAPSRKIIFRPKPRALDFAEIDGATLSLKPDTIEDAIAGAACLVTYTSHCSVNAVIAGVPVVALGPNPATPIAGKFLEQAVRPPHLPHKKRAQWLYNLAYAQWTPEEIAAGAMWEFICGEMAATLPATSEPRGLNKSARDDDDEDLCDDPGEVGVEGSGR